MSDDEAAMRAEVARFNPADVEAYVRFMRRSADYETCHLIFEPAAE